MYTGNVDVHAFIVPPPVSSTNWYTYPPKPYVCPPPPPSAHTRPSSSLQAPTTTGVVSVTCTFTADDIVDSVYYNSVDISSTVPGISTSVATTKTVSVWGGGGGVPVCSSRVNFTTAVRVSSSH